MRRILTIAALALAALTSHTDLLAQKKETKTATVVYATDIFCDNCKKRIESNICYEKGVKELSVDVPAKTVTITYRKDKTDANKLLKALTELGYTTFIKEGPVDTQPADKKADK